MELRAHRCCYGTVAPVPLRAAIRAMLAEIGLVMAARGYCAVALRCESWRLAPPTMLNGMSEFVARIEVEVEPGEMKTSLASWYEWQHPHWAWSIAPLPLDLSASNLARAQEMIDG